MSAGSWAPNEYYSGRVPSRSHPQLIRQCEAHLVCPVMCDISSGHRCVEAIRSVDSLAEVSNNTQSHLLGMSSGGCRPGMRFGWAFPDD